MRPPSLATPPPPPGQHDLAYRARDTLRLTRGSDGKHQLSSVTEVRRTVLSARAARWRRSSIADPYYAPVSGLTAWLGDERLEAKAITHLTPDLRDVFLSDFKVYQLDFGAPRPGDELSYRFARRYKQLAFAPTFYLPNLDYVASYELRVEHPTDVQVDFRLVYSTARHQPTIQRSTFTRAGRPYARTTLRLTNLQRFDRLPYFPHDGFHATIWPRFLRQGKSLVPDTLDSFRAWYRTALKQVKRSAQADKALATRLARGAKSPREKLARIYDFVRREVRYVADERGINAWIPRPAAQVADQRYGDCKDKAFLIQQLAAALGIDVDLVLVSVGHRPSYARGVHIGMFDHMIARWSPPAPPPGRAPHGGPRPAILAATQAVYLDGTCRHCEFGNWPEADVHKRALAVTTPLSPLFHIPAPARKPSLELTIVAHVDQPTRAKAQIVLRNELHWAVQSDEERFSGAKLRTRLSARLGSRLRGILLKNLTLKRRPAQAAETIVTGEADLSHFVVRAGDRRYLPRTAFAIVPERLLDRAGDRLPLFIERREALRLTLQLAAPGYGSKDLGSWRRGSDTLASASVELQARDGGFSLVYAYTPQQKIFRGEKRRAFLSFCHRYRLASKSMISLEREGSKP